MKKILLLGAGYATMSFIKSIDNAYFKKAEFTLINPYDYHYHTVLLHKVAAFGEDVRFKFSEILPKEIKVIQDKVLEITSDGVITKNATFSGFDYIISGLGFSSESFGIKGVGEYALNLTDYESGLRIHQHIKSKIEQYLQDRDENNLRFIVCGGGLTGVELASEMALSIKKQSERLGIPSSKIKIFIIEAMPSIIPMFAKSLIAKAYKRLESLGVEVRDNSKILECFKDGIRIDNNGNEVKITANTIIWTAGVKGNEVIQKSFPKSIKSKIEVNSEFLPLDNSTRKHFFIGDNCALKDTHTGTFYPATAQVTIQQGRFLAKHFPAILNGEKITDNFSYKMVASFCSLGDGYAIGELFGIRFSGRIASFFKSLIEWLWKNRIQAGF
ncbi:hypothetical protein CCY99_07905 [Helicobacter sp. 16-1353]|uniref:NAD(P)/FAD-dependent oxidoreductase n=1 Tax=Helicobacter sp. 16-1353 TaxID=2004996 RepID=UPI000DCE6CD1|nr:FAD-dependent oxidoreductase [Helicobacter sp. 16-1353]RAX52065.1 hypothetical protein CCY99_07905 [Helicobacter sp. 16-1353]